MEVSVEIEPDAVHGGFRARLKSRAGVVSRTSTLDVTLLNTSDYAQLRDIHNGIQALGKPPFLVTELDAKGGDDGEPTEVTDPDTLWAFIDKRARHGLYLQRYKGLGEMNAETLWDTTMNPESRMLLQVRIDDAVQAEEMFSVLMGDQVEPRREFIDRNALNVRNLDI
jgi:DNA gyrase subunit B